MNSPNRLTTSTVVLAAVGIAVFTLCVLGADRRGGDVQQRMENFTLPHYDEGRLVWRVKGSVAHIFNNSNIVLENPRLLVVETDDKPGYRIAADKAVVTENRTIIDLDGNVQVVGTDNSSLMTDDLKWSMTDEEATTRSHASMKRENMHLSGVGLTVLTTKKSFSLKSEVSLTLPQQKLGGGEEGDVTIQSPGAMDYTDDVAVFTGRATVNAGESTMVSDKLTLELDPATESLKNGIAEGKVELDSPEMTSEAERAQWSPNSDIVALDRNVFMRNKQSGDTVRCASSRISLDGNRMWCSGPVDALFYPSEAEEDNE